MLYQQNYILKKDFFLTRLTFLRPNPGSTRWPDTQICSLLSFSAVDSFIHAYILKVESRGFSMYIMRLNGDKPNKF